MLPTDTHRALELYRESLALTRKNNVRSMMMPPWTNVVSILLMHGEFAEARRELEGVANFAREIGERYSSLNLIELYAALELYSNGDVAAAKTHLRQAFAGYAEIGARPVWALPALAIIAHREGNQPRALELLELCRSVESAQRAAIDLELRRYEPEIVAGCTPEEIAAGAERGRSLDPDQVLREFTEGAEPASSPAAPRAAEPEAV
jgi:hypothetical protein